MAEIEKKSWAYENEHNLEIIAVAKNIILKEMLRANKH
jgi:hypothetical protein